ncbi:acylphosphatase [Utexia brackfieldae]|uniref:acylphosphatase n=1 Tax=Utexia brackfieldae TaxID=3074108 RepID=UPI00370DD761
MTHNYIMIEVKGLVQGVGFRYTAYHQARNLGLTGYVRNRPNGEVEILVGGDKTKQQALISWIRQGGPRAAHIDDFTVQPFMLAEKMDSFDIRY